MTKMQKLCVAAVIAALYTALALCLAPVAFGPVQCRLAEALTVLAAVTPAAIPGLAVGCCLTNLAGVSMGASAVGLWDVLIGPLATLSAACLTYWLRRCRLGGVPWLSTLPPVVINALVVGAELTLVSPTPTWALFFTQTGLVALGQAVACILGGSLLYRGMAAAGLTEKIAG